MEPVESTGMLSSGRSWHLVHEPQTGLHTLMITSPTGQTWGPTTMTSDDLRRFAHTLLATTKGGEMGEPTPGMVVTEDSIIMMEPVRRDDDGDEQS